MNVLRLISDTFMYDGFDRAWELADFRKNFDHVEVVESRDYGYWGDGLSDYKKQKLYQFFTLALSPFTSVMLKELSINCLQNRVFKKINAVFLVGIINYIGMLYFAFFEKKIGRKTEYLFKVTETDPDKIKDYIEKNLRKNGLYNKTGFVASFENPKLMYFKQFKPGSYKPQTVIHYTNFPIHNNLLSYCRENSSDNSNLIVYSMKEKPSYVCAEENETLRQWFFQYDFNEIRDDDYKPVSKEAPSQLDASGKYHLNNHTNLKSEDIVGLLACSSTDLALGNYSAITITNVKKGTLIEENVFFLKAEGTNESGQTEEKEMFVKLGCYKSGKSRTEWQRRGNEEVAKREKEITIKFDTLKEIIENSGKEYAGSARDFAPYLLDAIRNSYR